jgi:hypothetical protein
VKQAHEHIRESPASQTVDSDTQSPAQTNKITHNASSKAFISPSRAPKPLPPCINRSVPTVSMKWPSLSLGGVPCTPSAEVISVHSRFVVENHHRSPEVVAVKTKSNRAQVSADDSPSQVFWCIRCTGARTCCVVYKVLVLTPVEENCIAAHACHCV